jgi:2-amino-4-hydroxy-6-hydroxymethyldihydropteridine diphosphokinase
MAEVFLGLGANLGDPREQLRWCVFSLEKQAGITIQQISSLYRTKPVGCDEPQPDYYNAVIGLLTEKSPRELMELGLGLEAEIGRKRSTKNAPRLLDVDLLLYGDEVVSESDLHIPHRDMHKRAFVLVPMAEIAPTVLHPEKGKSMTELLAQISMAGTECIAVGPNWAKPNEE